MNKIILSSESVLQTTAPHILESRPPEIFGNISLIVNCHKKEITHNQGRKYSVDPKKVIFHPIHGLLSKTGDEKEIIQVFQEINEAIWEALKTGNVFIHCLAGVHRAGTFFS